MLSNAPVPHSENTQCIQSGESENTSDQANDGEINGNIKLMLRRYQVSRQSERHQREDFDKDCVKCSLDGLTADASATH